MQYKFTNITLADDASGRKYVKTLASKAGDPDDRGFGLPFFNPEIISSVSKCLNAGEAPAFNLDAEIDEETVVLKQVYFRRATDEHGHVLDTPAINQKTGKPDPVRSLRVHTIYQYSMHDAYYVSGERKGMRIMEDGYDANGKPCKVPAKAFDFDDNGNQIKLYMRGWAKQERADNILAAFYMVAPPEYQQQIAPAATDASEQPAQQSLNDVANGMFQPGPAQQPAAQPAAQQVDPLAQ